MQAGSEKEAVNDGPEEQLAVKNARQSETDLFLTFAVCGENAFVFVAVPSVTRRRRHEARLVPAQVMGSGVPVVLLQFLVQLYVFFCAAGGAGVGLGCQHSAPLWRVQRHIRPPC